MAGDNAGAIAKITNITGSGTLTFTIDLTLNASTNAARVRYVKWRDTGDFSEQNIQELTRTVAVRSNWIQFLLELRGKVTSPEVEELVLDNQPKKK